MFFLLILFVGTGDLYSSTAIKWKKKKKKTKEKTKKKMWLVFIELAERNCTNHYEFMVKEKKKKKRGK